jgi:hypothetical protein
MGGLLRSTAAAVVSLICTQAAQAQTLIELRSQPDDPVGGGQNWRSLESCAAARQREPATRPSPTTPAA